MSLFPLTRRRTSVKALSRFPSRVEGGSGIDISKENGIWTVDLDYMEVIELPSVPNPDDSYILVYDDTTGQFFRVSVDSVLASNTVNIQAVINDGGPAIAAGTKMDLEVPFACTITAGSLFADQVGSMVVSIWRDNYANYPPDVSDNITGATPLTLAGEIKTRDETLTGWTTAISAGDVLRFVVDSASSIIRCTVSLTATRN